MFAENGVHGPDSALKNPAMNPSPFLPRREFLAVIAAALALATGCKPAPGGGGAGGTIKVGEFASLTGTEAAFGQSSHKGTQLAFEELNKAGGVLGKQIEHS